MKTQQFTLNDIKKAFVEGFMASAEGYNGEGIYPSRVGHLPEDAAEELADAYCRGPKVQTK